MSATPMTPLHIRHATDARPEARPDRGAGHDLAIALGHAAGALLGTVAVWRERASQRRQLAAMDDYLLKDVGLSRIDVEQEYAKPFWRP